MRIGLLSDTHLPRANSRLRNLLSGPLGDVEMFLHAGDHVGDEVIEYLQHAEPRPYVGVAGNMDLGRLGRQLPERRVLTVAGRRLGLVHGWGAPAGLEERLLLAFQPAVDILVYGHSHESAVRRRGNTLLVNPGSALAPRSGRVGSVAILSLEADGVEVESIDVPL